jgi:hypothetical protein
MVASFRDPARTFKPIEVVERLLEIAEFYGGSPILYISSDEDLISYLDSFGFDIYSLSTNTHSVGGTRTGVTSAFVLFAPR